MADKNDKSLFTLDVVSSIDDDVIEKNLKKRFELWQKKDKRRPVRMPQLIAAAACLCIIIGTLFAILPNANGKQPPVYIGMTVSNEAPDTETVNMETLGAHTLTFGTHSFGALSATANPALNFASVLGNVEKDKETKKDKEDKNGNGKAPEIVFGETYYAMKNEDIYIHIHLTNPDEFEILSFTLNGKKYSSNMFEYGSDLETLIIKYNVGDVNGLQEYTIDAIKYVDGEKIKDVRMEGDKTVKVFVNDDTDFLSFRSTLVGFDLKIEPIWSAEFTGNKTVTSLSLWEGEQKLRDLELETALITDLPEGKRLMLKATYMDGENERTVQHIFDTRAQSAGLAVSNGTVVGIGNCTDSVIYVNMPISDQAFESVNLITEVYTGSNCTSIGADAFFSCDKLTKVFLGEGLEALGAGAFFLCGALKEVSLPDSMTSMGYAAFSNCLVLEKIIIPDGVTRIGESTFHMCEGLKEIKLPEKLTYVGHNAFRWCWSLSTVTIPAGVQFEDGTSAFSEVGVERVIFADGTTEIPSIFKGALALQSVVIPSSVKTIERYAFTSNDMLQYVEYQGTKSEWEMIDIKNPAWMSGVEIRCTDGSFKITE